MLLKENNQHHYGVMKGFYATLNKRIAISALFYYLVIATFNDVECSGRFWLSPIASRVTRRALVLRYCFILYIKVKIGKY